MAEKHYGCQRNKGWQMEERATTDSNNPACKFFDDSSCRTSYEPWTELPSMGGQANSVCQPCYVQLETTLHLVAQCPYSKAIWTELTEWSELQCLPTPRRNFNHLKTWWQAMAARGAHSLQDNQSKLQKLLYSTIGKSGAIRCMIAKPYQSATFALQSRMMCTYGTLLGIQPVSLFQESRTCSSTLCRCGILCVLCFVFPFVSRMCCKYVLGCLCLTPS
jgi:hypothetical protein